MPDDHFGESVAEHDDADDPMVAPDVVVPGDRPGTRNPLTISNICSILAVRWPASPRTSRRLWRPSRRGGVPQLRG
jgi:hypothetical protein